MWSQGIHGRSGVTCADCHMPEIRYGGQTITDHQVNSPLLKIEARLLRGATRALRAGGAEGARRGRAGPLLQAAERRDGRAHGARRRSREGAKAAGKTDAELEAARYLQRRAQFFLDFVEAENSTGFHAPQEALRILGDSMNYTRQGQLVLRDPTFKPDVKIVAVPTAQPGPNRVPARPPPPPE